MDIQHENFGEMAIIERHLEKKIKSKLADRGNTVLFVGYLSIHEKYVFMFMYISKKTMFSRDVICLNKTDSQPMGISQVDFISSEVEVEDDDMEEEEAYKLKGEGYVVPPPTSTKDDHIEQLMDLPETTSTSAIVAPYPTSTRQLRSSVVHAPKNMAREIRSL
jgi:hypothetical protein